WSVATQSIVPERSASISTWRSLSVRSGGFILKRLASSDWTASSVRQRWWGVTSQVTFTHAAFACSTAKTDSRAGRCCRWRRAVDHRVGVRHRENLAVAAGRRGARAGVDVLLVLAPGRAQVHVRVDERGERVQPVGVERLGALGGLQRVPDLRDLAAAHEDVG